MDDRKNAVQPTRAKARRVPADGIIGRLTYTPAQGDECIGQIGRNLAKDETSHFKQITPFTQWCAPAKAPTSPLGDLGPAQVARSQKYWLSEHLPEAAVNDEAIESLLLEEIASSQTNAEPALDERTPLFSVGEVADLRQGDSAKSHPVLAVASGVSGNILRLISLAREEWTWTAADIKVPLHVADTKLEGEWRQDGGPISLVKFALDPRRYDPIRWLLVSNGTSTTVYEPELRMIPMPVVRASIRPSGQPVGSQIFADPLFTISCERTGGSLQADVCFVRHPEEDTPRIATIDQAGYWSLWEITGRRNRPKNLTPVMRMCGNIVSGFIPKLPSNSMAEPQPHKLLWLSFGQKYRRPPRRSVSRARSPPEQSRTEPEPQPPRRLLLLCGPQNLHLFDLGTRKMHPVSHLVLQKDRHRILDVAPSRLDPAQAFILTTVNLLWVTVKEGKNDTLTLDVLISCPHQKDVSDPTLRLDVSPGAYINDFMACFACVRSTKNTEMTVFWFINPEPGTPVRYHRDLVSLQSPSNFVGLGILPAGRRMGSDEPTSEAGRAMRRARLRFFQLLTLGQNLDVHSALCAWSSEAALSLLPPDTKETLETGGNRRLRLLQDLTDAFAVPDEFDERAVFGKKGVESLALEKLKAGIQLRVDFRLLAQRLSAVEPATMGRDGMSSQIGGVDFGFIGDAMERGKEDDYVPRHSLLDLAVSRGAGVDLIHLAREWDAQQEALHRHAGEWLFVPEARRPLIDFGPDDLVDKLRDLFLGPNGEEGPRRQNREEVLQNMAAEMFLSNIGVSALPRSWTATESQLSSSLPFPSSPSIMPSQPPLPSFVKGKGKEKVKAELSEEEGDAVVLRLRKYATLDTSPTTHGEPVLALSRWDLGADPDDITWKPGQDLEAKDALNRRRRKMEARRRKAERLSQRIFGDDSMMLDSSSQSLGGLSSQPFPTILSTGPSGSSQRQSQSHSQSQAQIQQTPGRAWDFSSQQQQQQTGAFGSPRVFAGSPLRKEYRRDSGMARGGIFSSQLAQPEQGGPSQGTPSQPRSQVLPGLFGARPSFSPFKRSPLKKMKRKSELRLSGFR
ncbi:RNA polymerase I-specific transcription-initiation factor-domain-containing protein [Chaetomium fimeti]|uniref:RNA polymerase I-specific transcription-initiation factor-domain-containing protein n=1 Tax=Chaetomium fimeti TaxID=1854472 RepID=A0AAE0LUU7_9PEZI|nr:RNA polymerase I-specific transcription-initiation factor-domain-containing protein [Chaetomium fimeti]